MALEKVYDYFHNYDKQTYQVVACMGNEPSEHDINHFEQQGIPFVIISARSPCWNLSYTRKVRVHYVLLSPTAAP